jgi:hypothetical protein
MFNKQVSTLKMIAQSKVVRHATVNILTVAAAVGVSIVVIKSENVSDFSKKYLPFWATLGGLMIADQINASLDETLKVHDEVLIAKYNEEIAK